jgi:hypothetical protein
VTGATEPAGGVVRSLRPPVHASTLVRSDVSHTFTVFVATIGTWWPSQPFSVGKARVRDITVENHVGGRVFETWDDGTRADWGEVLAWNPPDGFTITWLGTPAPTEVELTFRSLGPRLTRVAVEHRGWDLLTDEQLAEDCALPGGYSSGAYAIGWNRILAAFAAAVVAAET